MLGIPKKRPAFSNVPVWAQKKQGRGKNTEEAASENATAEEKST
jgi:hypothetical protein